jgi:hypothetical protein
LTIAGESLPALRGYLLLSRTDSYAAAADEAELQVGDQPDEGLTVEAWINLSDLSDFDIVNKTTYRLYAKYKYESPNGYRCLGAELRFQGGAFRTMEACNAFSTGKGLWLPGWHHAAMSLDRTTGKWNLYLDGERGAADDVGELLADTADPLRIGAGAVGAVDEVRVSDVARYTGPGFTVPVAPLPCDTRARALWRFDEADGATTLHDACGSIDNVLVGDNGAHAEGVPAQRVYLPVVCR